MEGLIVLLYIALIYLSYLIISPITVVVHELGHAFAYLILTKPDNIDIYIGSHSKEKSLKFRLSKLTFYVHFSFPLFKHTGMCVSSKPERDYLKAIIISLSGVFATTLVAIASVFIIFHYDMHGVLKMICIVFFIFSLWDLYYNLAPLYRNNVLITNDGKNIRFALKLKKQYSDYVDGHLNLNSGNYLTAVNNFETAYNISPDIDILRNLLTACCLSRNVEKGKIYAEILKSKPLLNSNDYLSIGYIYSVQEEHSLAIDCYKIALLYNPFNLACLNNIGIEYAETGEFDKAEENLTDAIKIHPDFGSAYSMLGYSFILKGDVEKGKQYLDKGIEIDPDYAYAYKALGLYYLKANKQHEADLQFQKALEIDHTINLNFSAAPNT